MGNASSEQSYTCNYEDIQRGIVDKDGIMIHIMDNDEMLIVGTTSIDKETATMNQLLNDHEYDTHIIVYGKNTDDYERLVKKRGQLMTLGFRNVWFYPGGLFEWSLLQDIFGKSQFPTTNEVRDIIRYRQRELVKGNSSFPLNPILK